MGERDQDRDRAAYIAHYSRHHGWTTDQFDTADLVRELADLEWIRLRLGIDHHAWLESL